MVKKIVIFFAYMSFFMLALIYFTPKVSAYYLLESQLKKFDVIVGSERINDSGFALEISDANIFVKSIDSVNIQNTNIKLLGLYNSINISGVTLSSTAKSFLPLKIEQVNLNYHVFNPLNMTAFAIGEFGEATVVVNIMKRTLKVKIVPSALMKKKYKNTLRNFKKSENGELIYDKTF